jgi:calcineurin-like phosphoesterase family protein
MNEKTSANRANIKYKSLLFLHLSDIHFSKSSNGTYDLDEDIRNQLMQDAGNFVSTKGKSVQSILVTGDIAYSGKNEEYQHAKDWLTNIASALNCPSPIILLVPGNHDVDRAIYENNIFFQKTVNSIINCNSDSEINMWLKKVYESQQSEDILFLPIKNYNIFASEFGCELSHKQQFWECQFNLENDVTVNLRGLNSVIGSCNSDSRGHNLFLGSKQLELKSKPRSMNITLCHHPPDWLRDRDQVHRYLSDRASIQLFGHKHSQFLDDVNGKLRITAGAMHPSRAENEWVPRYNFIELLVEESNSVKAKVYPRIWNNTKFSTDYNSSNGREFIEKTFDFEPNLNPEEVLVSSSPSAISLESEILINETSNIISEETNMSSSGSKYGKILIRRFLSLDEYTRNELIRQFNLNEPIIVSEQPMEFYKEAFIRAKQRKLLECFWQAVESHHGDSIFEDNPFKGN